MGMGRHDVHVMYLVLNGRQLSLPLLDVCKLHNTMAVLSDRTLPHFWQISFPVDARATF